MGSRAVCRVLSEFALRHRQSQAGGLTNAYTGCRAGLGCWGCGVYGSDTSAVTWLWPFTWTWTRQPRGGASADVAISQPHAAAIAHLGTA